MSKSPEDSPLPRTFRSRVMDLIVILLLAGLAVLIGVLDEWYATDIGKAKGYLAIAILLAGIGKKLQGKPLWESKPRDERASAQQYQQMKIGVLGAGIILGAGLILLYVIDWAGMSHIGVKPMMDAFFASQWFVWLVIVAILGLAWVNRRDQQR